MRGDVETGVTSPTRGDITEASIEYMKQKGLKAGLVMKYGKRTGTRDDPLFPRSKTSSAIEEDDVVSPSDEPSLMTRLLSPFSPQSQRKTPVPTTGNERTQTDASPGQRLPSVLQDL
jgi:hypothetical protein